MSTSTVTHIIDDISGVSGASPHTFALDGKVFEIDLIDDHWDQLQNRIVMFIEHSRAVKVAKVRGKNRTSKDDIFDIRCWSEWAGIKLPARGRIPKEHMDRYARARSVVQPGETFPWRKLKGEA